MIARCRSNDPSTDFEPCKGITTRGPIRLDDLTAARVRYVHSIAERTSFGEVRFPDNRSGQELPGVQDEAIYWLCGRLRSPARKLPHRFTIPTHHGATASFRRVRPRWGGYVLVSGTTSTRRESEHR